MEEMKERINLDRQFALTTGSGINIGDDIRIYPLTIGEIGDIGFDRYQEMLGAVLITKEMLEDLSEEQLATIKDFDIVVSNCLHNEDYKLLTESSLTMFTREEVKFVPEYGFFVVGDIKEMKLISRKNFEEIADIIREQNMLEKPKLEERKPQESKKIRELRAKMEKGRKALAKAKNQKESTTIVDLIMIVGAYIEDYYTIKNWTLYQLYQAHMNLSKKENYKERFDTYLAGGDPKKLKLDTHWSRME